MRLALAEDPTTLDPVQIVDVAGADIAAKVYAGLVRVGPRGDIEPDLAESWAVTDEGRCYTFILRPGLAFHTGRAVTAKSVVASLERLADPAAGSRRAWLLDAVAGVDAFRSGEAAHLAGVEAVDAHRVRIYLREPSALLLDFLAMPNAAIVDPAVAAKGPMAFAREPAGAGPYRLAEWRRGQYLELDAFDRYYAGKPRNSEILYSIVPEEFSRVAMFERGDLDILDIPLTYVQQFRSDPRWTDRIRQLPGLNTYYVGINCRRFPGTERPYRQALNLAVNRPQVIRTQLAGAATPARGPVPAALLPAGLSAEGWAYDPDRARELLQTIPLPAGPLQLYVRATKQAIALAESLQAYFAQVGLEVEVVQREWSALKDAIVNGEADLFLLSWYADYPSAENFLAPVFHSDNWGAAGNRARYANPAVDRLIRQLQHAHAVADQRLILAQLLPAIVEDAPWVFLWHQDQVFVTQPWIENFSPSPIPNGDRMLATVSTRMTPGGVHAAEGRSLLTTAAYLTCGLGLLVCAIRTRGYVTRRVLVAVPTLVGVTIVTFVLLHSLPGDPVLALVGQRADEATLQQLRADLDLDAPMVVQYGRYLALIVRGDLGRSYFTGEPVGAMLLQKFPNTLRLAVAAMVVSAITGSLLGVFAAIHRGRWLDTVCTAAAVLGLSTPTFWLGLVLVYVFAHRLGVLPVAGMGQGQLAFLVLPAITLGTQSAAFVARVTRTALLEVFQRPFLVVARAKGLPEWRVTVVHAYRNALLPVITLFGVDLGSYLNGAVLTETIFGWDGIGRYAMTGVLQRDYPVILGTVLFGAAVFTLVNVLVDLSYAMLDPRVRVGDAA